MTGTLLITGCIIYLIAAIIIDVRARKGRQEVEAERNARRRWSEHEEELLREECSMWGAGNFDGLAEELGRTPQAVRAKARRMGLVAFGTKGYTHTLEHAGLEPLETEGEKNLIEERLA